MEFTFSIIFPASLMVEHIVHWRRLGTSWFPLSRFMITNLSRTDTVSLRSVSVLRRYLKNGLVPFLMLVEFFSRSPVIK